MTLQSGCPICGAGQVKREIIISHDCGLKISVTAEVEVWQLPGERLDGNGSYLHAVSFEPVPPAADAPRGPTWEEIRHGTPDTPERIETIRRADETFAKTRAPAPAPSGDDVPGEWPDSENHGEPAAPAPSEALLPCPFCGAPPVVVMPEENYGGPECHTPNCPASPLTTGDWPDMRAAHFAVWNRRVAPQEPTDEAVTRALEDIWRTGDPTAYRLQSAIDTVRAVNAARERAKGSG